MKVYALVGKSGTGKSHRALFVAKQYNIDFLIDDGLLIHNNKKITGSSAKREATYIAAVKRAIFHDESHRMDVVKHLNEMKANKLLLIGTSVNMVEKIARHLSLPQIETIIMIEDISSPEEIAKAKEMRHKYGKHVIPVPTVELKKDFSGYFLDKLKVFSFLKGSSTLEVAEKSVVRPTFSYLGRYTISNRALIQIASYYLERSRWVDQVLKLKFYKTPTGIVVVGDLVCVMGCELHKIGESLSGEIKEGLEAMTQLHIERIELHIKHLRVKER